jgi:hypothetical protein
METRDGTYAVVRLSGEGSYYGILWCTDRHIAIIRPATEEIRDAIRDSDTVPRITFGSENSITVEVTNAAGFLGRLTLKLDESKDANVLGETIRWGDDDPYDGFLTLAGGVYP